MELGFFLVVRIFKGCFFGYSVDRGNYLFMFNG